MSPPCCPGTGVVPGAGPGLSCPRCPGRGLMGICRDLKREARIGPGSLAKSPELLNLWGAGAPGASSITWTRGAQVQPPPAGISGVPGRRSQRCCPQADARVLPCLCPCQNLRWRDSSRFVWTEGLQTLFVFQRLGKGSPWLGQRDQPCLGGLGALGGRVGTPGPSGRNPKGGGLPSPPSLPQRPCSTATSTRGRRCTWATPSSTRTRSGCARSLRSSAADGTAPACGPSAAPRPEGRIQEAGGTWPGP